MNSDINTYKQRFFEQQRNDTQKENVALCACVMLAVFDVLIPGVFVALYWLLFVIISNRLKRQILFKIVKYQRKESSIFWINEGVNKKITFYRVRLMLSIFFIIYFGVKLWPKQW